MSVAVVSEALVSEAVVSVAATSLEDVSVVFVSEEVTSALVVSGASAHWHAVMKPVLRGYRSGNRWFHWGRGNLLFDWPCRGLSFLHPHRLNPVSSRRPKTLS